MDEKDSKKRTFFVSFYHFFSLLSERPVLLKVTHWHHRRTLDRIYEREGQQEAYPFCFPLSLTLLILGFFFGRFGFFPSFCLGDVVVVEDQGRPVPEE